MASGTLGADESRERHRWGEGNKVYTRKIHKGLKINNNNTTTTITSSASTNTANNGGNNTATTTVTTATTSNNENNNDDKNNSNTVPQQSSQTLAVEDANSSQQQQTLSRLDAVSDDSSSHNQAPQVAALNGFKLPNENGAIKPVITKVENRVRINLAEVSSKNEARELKRKLVKELDQVRSFAKKLETKEVHLTGYSTGGAGAGGHSHTVNDRRALVRVNSEVGSVGHHDSRLALVRVNSEVGSVGHHDLRPALVRVNSEVCSVGHHDSRPASVRVNSEVGSVGHHDSRPFRKLSVSVMQNNQGVREFVEKEKRTPKANQYYENSEFLLGKERLPPAENKKLKSNGGKKRVGEVGYGFVIDKYTSRALKSCNNLLTRLMKHKHAWVFNKPVDAKALGLHDYHEIIKHPMDLGTVKGRLAKNWYKSPREFAEDVRLTFCNAMTYNPKGQDVHIMAEDLLKIFEEKWVAIEFQYSLDWRYQLVLDVGLPTPTSRKVDCPHPPPPALEIRTLERAESMTMAVDSKLKPNTPVGRTPVPKKPKAKDPHKRDMTYEEKQRLSTNLQSLPSEKLDSIVQIVKKRNSAVSQHDDEIEVDIDSVDAETLWELDRLVTNYKKSLSKKKRKAELATQARAEATQAVPAMNRAPAIVEAPKESKTDEKNATTSSPAKGERLGDNVCGTSSSSSSSSDSGSSSSDSDSDSSSSYGSDAGHSPRT